MSNNSSSWQLSKKDVKSLVSWAFLLEDICEDWMVDVSTLLMRITISLILKDRVPYYSFFITLSRQYLSLLSLITEMSYFLAGFGTTIRILDFEGLRAPFVNSWCFWTSCCASSNFRTRTERNADYFSWPRTDIFLGWKLATCALPGKKALLIDPFYHLNPRLSS